VCEDKNFKLNFLLHLFLYEAKQKVRDERCSLMNLYLCISFLDMLELTRDYIESLATQSILISALLGGMSTTILGALVLAKQQGKIINAMIITTAVASFLFIIAMFAMTNLYLVSHPDFPLEKSTESIDRARLIGGIAFNLGVLTFVAFLGQTGWVKSKAIGITTTVLAIISYFFLFTLS